MKGIPCGVWDILMDLEALFGVEIHALKVTYQHFNGGPFRAVPGGIGFQIFFHGLRVGGDGEGHLGPVVFPGCIDAPLHIGLVHTQDGRHGNALLRQQVAGKSDVLCGVGGLRFQQQGIFRYAFGQGYATKALGLAFCPHLGGVSAQSAGKEHPGGKTIPIELSGPAGNILVIAAEAHDAVRFLGGLIHAQIVPENLRTGKRIHENHPFTKLFCYHIKIPLKKQEFGVDKMKKQWYYT